MNNYSIKYIKNGETYVGYGTYNPEVLSQYLQAYFISSAQPKINNQINLCDSCRHTYPDCPAGEDDILLGNGAGNDNIAACGKYEVEKRNTGHWRKVSSDKHVRTANYIFSCSECRETAIGTPNFCPNCGADMRGDTECKNGKTTNAK